MLDDREPEPGAPSRAPAVGAEEALEQPGDIHIGHARAVVGDVEHDVTGLVRECDHAGRSLAGVAEGRYHDVGRRLHQRNFRSGFIHAATAHHGVGADDTRTGQLLVELVEDEEAVGLLHADGSRRKSALAQEVGYQFQRLVMLVPGPDFGGDAETFLDRRFFEEWCDDDRVAANRNHGPG